MPWSIFQQGGGSGVAVTWAQQLLQRLGVPVSQENVQFVYDWEESEGGGGKYNPLNQGPVPGQPQLTTTGQQYGGGAADFASWQAGQQGAVDYINMPAYSGVLAGLRRSSYSDAAQALWASPWAGSHYGYGSAWSRATPPGAAPIPAQDLANTTSSVWAWLIHPSEQNATSRPGDAVLAQLPGSDSSLSAGSPVTYQGQQWIVYSPTYPTKAEAQGSPVSGAGGPSVPGANIPGVSGIADAISSVAQAIENIVTLLNTLLNAIEWLFVPSHWVRIFCFIGGVLLAIPGGHALMHTGESDVSLALGILMISLSGMLFFIAFHNLPDSVNSLQSLLGHVSTGISGQAAQPAASGG